MTLHSAFLTLAVVVSLLAASPASAQSRRSSRPLFGSGPGATGQELTASGSAGGGYDTNAQLNASESGIIAPLGRGTDSTYSLLSGGVNYSVETSSFGLGATGSTSRRYYFSTAQDALSTYNGGIGASFAVSPRARLGVNQTMTYQPFSLYSLFPQPDPPGLGEPDVPGIDYYTSRQSYLTYSTSATFSQQLSRRATFSADYSHIFSDTPGDTGDYTSDSGSVRFTRSFKQGIGIRLGYGYTTAHYSAVSGNQSYHTIDSGVDYAKTLSLSRRTTFSFSTGAAAVTSSGDLHFLVIGSANLRHQMGRTWEFTAGYNRDVQFVEAYAGPVEYQSMNAQLSGRIARQLSFNTGVGATGGDFVGATESASAFGFGDVYSMTGLGWTLNQYLSLSVDYSLYWYSYNNAVVLPEALASNARRQTLSASLNAGALLFQRGRRRDASR